MSQIIRERETVFKDFETGEIKQSIEEKTTYHDQEPNYIKLYLQDISHILKLPKNTDKILLAFLRYMTYNNEITTSGRMKREICQQLDIKVNTLEHHITELVQKNVFTRIDRGVYGVNPFIFGRGSWREIAQIRKKFTISFSYDSEHGKTTLISAETNDENRGEETSYQLKTRQIEKEQHYLSNGTQVPILEGQTTLF